MLFRSGITQNPTKYNPITNPENNAERREKVLANMLDQGYITESEYEEALADDVYSRIQAVDSATETSVYSYFVDALIEQVVEDLQEVKGYSESQAYKLVYSGGLSIYTTQDSEIQAICDEEYQNEENYPENTQYSFTLTLAVEHSDGSYNYYDEQSMLSWAKENGDVNSYLLFDSEEEAAAAIELYEESLLGDGDSIPENGVSVTYTAQPQASIVVMDQSTGEVKAVVGGRGEKEASLTLNRATDTYRQPGSTFKILSTYAPALDTGEFTLASVQDDAPYQYSDGTTVHNYDNSYRGWTTLRKAITNSINVVTVKTLTDITPAVGYEYLLKFGFTSLSEDTDVVQALALGGITKGVSNLELTAAYATIANGGTYTEPIFYTKILDHEGNVLIDNTPDTTEVISEQTAWLLTDAMEDVVTSGTGTAVNFGTTAIAGKTGTTSNNVDSWFVGYTTSYTCGVWGGYDTNASMDSTSFTKALWKAVMSRIHEDMDYEEFTQPDGIVTASVCNQSGLLSESGVCSLDVRGSTVFTEYFAEGTVPTAYCNHHVLLNICSESGLLASDYCPEDSIVQKAYLSEGSSSSADAKYLASTLLNTLCDIHSATSTEEEEDEEDDTTTESEETESTEETTTDSTLVVN